MYLNARWTTKREEKQDRNRWDRVKVMEKNQVLRWYWEIRKKSEKLGNRDIRRFILMLLVFNLKTERSLGFFFSFFK